MHQVERVDLLGEVFFYGGAGQAAKFFGRRDLAIETIEFAAAATFALLTAPPPRFDKQARSRPRCIARSIAGVVHQGRPARRRCRGCLAQAAGELRE